MQGDGVIPSFVARAEEQRHASTAGRAGERRNRHRVVVQFFAVTADELAPALRLMPEPSAQRDARRDVFQPEVDRGVRFAEAAGPEPIDEHADAVVFRRRRVRAFHLNHRRFHGFLFLHDYN